MVTVHNPNVGRVYKFHSFDRANQIAELQRKVSFISVKKRPKGCKGDPRRAVLILITGGVS